MTDAYQNRTPTAVARLRYGAIGSDSFHDCSCASLPAYDILSGEGAEDFLHWAVPRGAHCPDGVDESAGLPKGLLALSRVKLRRRSRACCSKQRASES